MSPPSSSPPAPESRRPSPEGGIPESLTEVMRSPVLVVPELARADSALLATWRNPDDARILRSVREVREAVAAGELGEERPGAVVNMPVIRWPAGER